MSGPDWTEEVAGELAALRAARAGLVERPAVEIASVLGSVGRRFLDPTDPLRREALERIPGEAGLSPAMAARVVDGMARDWTPRRLETLLNAEFGDPGVLDRFVPSPVPPPEGRSGDRRLMAVGDGVALHIGAGSVPGVCATSMVRSLLVKTPVLVKPGGGDRALTELFRRGLVERDAQVAAAATVRYWAGGSWPDEKRLLAGVDRVVVYGSDQTGEAVRRSTPAHVPVVPYHHRSSLAVIGEEALADGTVGSVAAGLAFAASTFDQRGCVSPHRVWVLGSEQGALRLAEATALAMAEEAEAAPPGEWSDADRARVQQLRGHIEMEEAAGRGARLWAPAGTSWTVVLDPAGIVAAGAPRTMVIQRVSDRDELVSRLSGDGGHLQSVGLAGLGDDEETVVAALARIGATRFAPLADLPFPAAWWHHDGQGPLRALVRWAEWSR